MGLVHPVKPFKNVFLVLLGNTDAGILHFYIEKVIIHVQRHMHPSVFPVVLDSVLHQV